MSETLRALLRFAKASEAPATTWSSVAEALADLYHSDMRLADVLTVLLKAYEEAVMEPRFELNRGRAVVEELVTAPIRGFHSLSLLGSPPLDERFSVEQFYDAMVAHVIGQLRIARVDWCAEFRRTPTLYGSAPSALAAPA